MYCNRCEWVAMRGSKKAASVPFVMYLFFKVYIKIVAIILSVCISQGAGGCLAAYLFRIVANKGPRRRADFRVRRNGSSHCRLGICVSVSENL